jgi:enoyl-CoA hydratase
MAAAKQLLTRVPSMEFDAALDWAGELSARLFAAPEGLEGMTAYLEKRAPSWAIPRDRPDA